MKSNTLFEYQRFIWLIRNMLVLKKSPLMTVTGAICGIVVMLSFLDIFTEREITFHQDLYLFILFISGFIVSSKIFKVLHHRENGTAYLLIPASNFEKFTSRLFLSTVLFVIYTIIAYYLLSMITETLNKMIFGTSHALFNPFSTKIIEGVGIYLVLQSLFLLGGVYFKRHPFSKTILFLFLFFICLLVILVLSVKLLFWSYFDGFLPRFEMLNHLSEVLFSERYGQLHRAMHLTLKGFQFIFWFILAPLCWTIAYFRLRETEV